MKGFPGWRTSHRFDARGFCLGLALAALSAMQCAASGIDRRFLDDLLRIPSRCADEPQLLRVVDFTRDWLSARGVWCVVETNDAGRVALYAATRPGKVQDYLFVSHLDVVAAPDSMFAPRYDGDRVFARGACDTKGNVTVCCQVLANLVGKASVGLFLATDEDGGAKGQKTPDMMIERGYLCRKMAIVGDSAGEEPGQLFTAEKGHSRMELVAHGKGGHSSRPWALDNPVQKLFEGFLRFDREWNRGADPKEKWRTVLSPTMLKGSDGWNIVPDEAVLRISCRYISMAEYDRAVEALKRLSGLELRATPGRIPVENRPDDPEIKALLAAMNAGIPGGIREGRMSAATDASFYTGHGFPVVIFAADGGEPHSVREWGSLKSLDAYADFFTSYLGKVAAVR